MNDLTPLPKSPYHFSKAIFLPFRNGPGSLAFVLKSAVFYALIVTMLFVFFGKLLVGPATEYVELIVELGKSDDPDEITKQTTKLMGVMGRFFLPYMLILIGGWAVWATIEAAQHRRALRGEHRTGLFPWRFGGDELFVMLSHFVLYMYYMGLYTVVYIAIIISVLVAALLGSQSLILGIVGGVVAAAIIIASLGLMFWVLIRLAPTAALSVAHKDFAIGEAWAASKGRVWPTFGAYALLYIIGFIIIYGLLGVVGFAFVGSIISDLKAAGTGSGGAEVWEAIQKAFGERDTQVGFTIGTFIMFLFIGLWLQMIAGINTHVAQLFKKDEAAANVEMFD